MLFQNLQAVKFDRLLTTGQRWLTWRTVGLSVFCTPKICICYWRIIEKVHLDDLNVYLDTLDTQILLWLSALKLAKKLTQLVSTSNKRSSSGEMKKDQKRVGIYREKDLTPIVIKAVELWKIIFTPFQVVQWSLISVIWCGELLQLSSHTCGCVCHMGRWRNDITQFMSGDKELGLYINFCGKQLNWGSIEQVSSPACPSGGFWYVLSHVRSKIPNIVELG